MYLSEKNGIFPIYKKDIIWESMKNFIHPAAKVTSFKTIKITAL